MVSLFASTFSLLSILTILFVIPVQSIMLFEEEIDTKCDPHFPTACWTPDIDSLCFTDSRLYLDAFHSANQTKWALKMFKATGTLSLDGLKNMDESFTSSPGLFDECLAVKAPLFQGQYCSLFFESEGIKDTFLLPRIGFCIPSSCSAQDLEVAVVNLLTQAELEGQSSLVITDENYCYTREEIDSTPKFDGPVIAVIVLLSLIGLLVLSATLYDTWRLLNSLPVNTRIIEIFQCFSLLENRRKLMLMESRASDLSCLNGIRVLSATWTILFHTHRFIEFFPIENRFGPDKKYLYDWDFQVFTRGSVSVDTFFLLSGVLISYTQLRKLRQNNGSFNLFTFYLHRYLRLTPFYAIYFGFIATLLVYLGSGPLWYFVHQMSQTCRTKWWTHFLYINNYFIKSNPPAECMIQSWYLAADMQLFILSPLFIYPLWKWKKAGLAWIIFVITAVIGAIGACTFMWSLPATTMPFERPIGKSHSLDPNFYYQTWPRVPQFLTGILLGWILFIGKSDKDRNPLSIPRIGVAAGWILSMTTIIVIMYGLVPFLNEELVPEMNTGIRIVYGSLHRFGWTAAVGWIIFACVNGYAGFINTFLSWEGFTPLSRLTYVTYLVNVDYVKVFYIGLSRTFFYYSKVNLIMTYFAVLAVSFVLAFFLSVAIEMPFLNLNRILTTPPKKVLPKPRDHNENIS